MSAQERQVGKFGRIALEMGLVNWEQIQECLSLQMDYERSGQKVPRLGTLLLTRGHLTSKQVKDILDKQNSEREEKAETAVNNFLVSYKEGAVVFHEGDKKNRDLFLLNAGKIELLKRGVSINQRCGPGAFFGVSAFLLKTARSATAVAKTDCKAFRIPENKASDFFKSKPAMAVNLAMVLAKDLYILKNRYVETHLNAVEAAAQKTEAQQAPAGEGIQLPGGTNLVTDGNGRLQIKALGEKDKIRINRLQAAEGDYLNNGDKIQIGKHLLQFYSDHPDIEETQSQQDQPVSGIDALLSAAVVTEEKPQEEPPVAEVQEETNESTVLLSAAAENDIQALTPQDESEAENEIRTTHSSIDDDDSSYSYHIDESQFKDDTEDQEEEGNEDEDDKADNPDGEEGKTVHQPLTGDQSALPAPKSTAPADASAESILAEIDKLKSPPFNQTTAGAVSHRVSFWMQLEKIDQRRTELEEKYPEQSERFKSEIARQRREIQRIPPLEALQNTRNKIEERLNPKPPEPDEDGNFPPPPEPLPKDIQAAYKLAIEQKEVLIARDGSIGSVLGTCLKQALAEPLYRVFAKYDIDRGDIFGWMVYAQVLDEYNTAQNARLKELRAEINEVSNTKTGGFLGLGRKGKEEREQQLTTLQDEEKKLKMIILSISRELKAIEKDMVDEFWRVYGQCTQVLVAKPDPVDEPYLRSLLRWGMLGHSPMWFDPEKCKELLSECVKGPEDPIYNMEQNYVYYADEMIELITAGKLPPTSNEDLELNHRNSPLWRADRAWRKIINCTMQEGIYNDIMNRLAEEAKSIREDQTQAEEELTVVQGKAHDKNKKKRVSQLRHGIQNCKVKAGRLERLVEKLETETIPRSIEDKQQAKANLNDTGIIFTPAQLAEHEIKCMRRNARLVAKLKEPFLPFALRDRYKPENGCVNTRQVVIESMEDVEMRDPLILKEPLVPSAKKIHRILLRLPPVIAIAPAGGIMGFMMAPRAGMESGKIVIPAYFERANMKEEILWNVLSDFRFDTSKASAGVDVMNSDTLVAAYAQVRWDLRKRDKEVRQKAGIYMEENERTNWRRHYALYMKSALDSGKLLFYKCPELYELIINKFVDLPNGCEILKR